jgi:hypothetical protein
MDAQIATWFGLQVVMFYNRQVEKYSVVLCTDIWQYLVQICSFRARQSNAWDYLARFFLSFIYPICLRMYLLLSGEKTIYIEHQ